MASYELGAFAGADDVSDQIGWRVDVLRELGAKRFVARFYRSHLCRVRPAFPEGAPERIETVWVDDGEAWDPIVGASEREVAAQAIDAIQARALAQG